MKKSTTYASQQIKCCLNEYATGTFIGLELTTTKYGDVRTGMLAFIDMIQKNPYHGAKIKQRRRQWAKKGMELLRSRPNVSNQLQFRPVLD
ncbi:hypothetical protein JR316_0005531 [Psilocybe cubensis]|uniref:Uncharacterized protein n=2 Tax=Psilocybe cubensis TaxID=181762 RepID=A0ACB8GZE6_PSICU|nr:hypothetical protein JR316_0005531 [Psilocybe cubensis]KAH9481013.1 hypothetical protein JR316_0005531 [Psilocybe cubensis]